MERVGGTVADEGFVFIGEALALDFVNTEVVVRGKPRDLLTDPAAYLAWWRAACDRYPEIGTTFVGIPEGEPDVDPAALLESARELRAALRRIAAAVAEGGDGTSVEAGDLGVVNGILQAGHPVVSVDPGGMFRPMLAPHGAGPEAALLPIAHSALDLLTGKDPTRLHRCANERCVLLFYDTTKSATRRWCSVGCMNRARSAARHRARKRQSGDGALGAPRGAPPVL